MSCLIREIALTNLTVSFTMYMNGMERTLESTISMFAIDTKIIRPMVTENNRDILQNDIDKLMSNDVDK